MERTFLLERPSTRCRRTLRNSKSYRDRVYKIVCEREMRSVVDYVSVLCFDEIFYMPVPARFVHITEAEHIKMDFKTF